MRSLVLAAGLGLASFARAQRPAPTPVSSWTCAPGVDVRRLVSLEFGTSHVSSPHDAAGLPTEGHQRVAAFFLADLCRASGSPLQHILQGLRDPVRVVLAREGGGQSYYSASNRRVDFTNFAPCSNDPQAVLYHELTHAL